MTTVTILPPSSMASPMQVQFSLRGHSGARSPAVRAAETVMEAVAMSLEHLADSDTDRSARLLARAAEGAKPPCPFHEGCSVGSDRASAANYTAPGTDPADGTMVRETIVCMLSSPAESGITPRGSRSTSTAQQLPLKPRCDSLVPSVFPAAGVSEPPIGHTGSVQRLN